MANLKLTPQEAITILDNMIAEEQYSMMSLDREKPLSKEIVALEMAKEYIKRAEQTKSGSWIKEYLAHGDYVYRCSYCGAKVGQSYIEGFGNRDYCSKCGAKMDLE